MQKTNVRVEIVSEDALSNNPGRVRVYNGDSLVAEIFAIVENKQGADGNFYPCVTLTDNWFFCLLCGFKTPVPHICPCFYPEMYEKYNRLYEKVPTNAMTKATMVKHHDDPPCTARLDKNGDCPKCNLHPDTQSTCFYFYCPTCNVPLKNLKCSQCEKTFEHPN